MDEQLSVDQINALDHAAKLYRVTDATFGAVLLRHLADLGYLSKYGTVAGFNAYKITQQGLAALNEWDQSRGAS